MLAHGMALPGRPDLGPTDVTPASSFGELADAVIRRHLATLVAAEPGTRLGEDPEDLHDMRVATRRLRAAFSFFNEILPAQFAVLRAELSWLASILGAVRDLDVHLEGLEGAEEHLLPLPEGTEPPLDNLRAVLMEERQQARAVLLRALDSPRYERLSTGLASLAQQGAARRTDEYHVPAVVVVPGLVGGRYRSTSRAARQARRSGRPADFHRLRIRCKRLRYAVEFVGGLYGEPAQRFSRRLAKLQDALGAVQDASVATERLLHLAADDAHPLPPITVFVMGALAARHQLASSQLMAHIPSRMSRLDDREWQGLATLMEQRRAAAVREQTTPAIQAAVSAAPPDGPPPPDDPAQVEPDTGPPEPARPVWTAIEPTTDPAEPTGPVWTAIEPEQADPERDPPAATSEPDAQPPDALGQRSNAAPTSNGHGHHGHHGSTGAPRG